MGNKIIDVSKKYYVGAAPFKVLRSNQSFVRGLDLAKVTAKQVFRGAETIKVYTSSGAVVFKYDKALHEAEQKNAQLSDFDDLIPVNETQSQQHSGIPKLVDSPTESTSMAEGDDTNSDLCADCSSHYQCTHDHAKREPTTANQVELNSDVNGQLLKFKKIPVGYAFALLGKAKIYIKVSKRKAIQYSRKRITLSTFDPNDIVLAVNAVIRTH
jgi:hypothetical protein